jgi:hypothetical protein
MLIGRKDILERWKYCITLGIILIAFNATFVQGITIKEIGDLHSRDNSLIDVFQIWFNWAPDSQAITIKGCDEKETPLETPEYDNRAGRDNPVAYIKGTRFTIKVKFTSESVISTIIKATGSLGGLPETQVEFYNGESEWISFLVNETLPQYIKRHDIQWNWSCYDVNANQWAYIGNTSHTVYALNRKPLTDQIYENLTRWTTEWCEHLPIEDQDNDKKIADAIINGFDTDGVIQYGDPGWDTAEVLRTGDGMCAGMSFVFYDACATQGIEVTGLYFRLMDTNKFDPQILWNGIIFQDPGLGRTEPGWSVEMVWKWVNTTYPYPRYYGIWNDKDDIDSEFKRAYIFYKFDGHVVNLLEYNGEVFLYDLSFGKGPYLNTFTTIPEQGIYTSIEMRNFRENYHDIAIDHMNGRIYYEDEREKIKIDLTNFSVKTSIIPDEIDGKNQMRYFFDVIDYSDAKSTLNIISNNEEYQDFFKDVKEMDFNFTISLEEIKLITNWLKNPSTEINWLILRNAVLKLGNSRGILERCYAKNILHKTLLINTEMNCSRACSLPGIMSPLNMVKTAVFNSLVNLENSKIKPFYQILDKMKIYSLFSLLMNNYFKNNFLYFNNEV